MNLRRLIRRKEPVKERQQRVEQALARRNQEAEQRLRMLEANAQVFRRQDGR